MIKTYLLFNESLIFVANRFFSTSNSLSFKWFYKFKHVYHQPKSYPSFENDWDHKLGFDVKLSEPIDGVTELEDYQKLPDILKQCYTNAYLDNKSLMKKEISDKAKELEINDFSHPLAYQFIKRTVQIRNGKKSLHDMYRDKLKYRAIRKLIELRKVDLRQLRIENRDLVDRISKQLGVICVPEEPRQYADSLPRYKAVRDEAKLVKQKKVKSLREDLAQSKEKFLEMKEKELEIIRKNLSDINLDIEEVLNEVIQDRRELLMQPIYEEKYGWFDKEKRLKVSFEKEALEKKAARERQQRR